ncbi:LysE family translocator [Asaia sp. As-1742]|uniref:LysE family translocator n=1 Tax=Asaia sp. As-1742 TaxID=2608325 RepID=UPI0014236F65|nr:LysE family translocator [Asaia sp. As-1742]NIE81592.1 LysE family translocator [Asaia sp. As-1742]
MPELESLLTFAAIALGMVLTRGPNMVYLISRSICQGRTAGLISLGGVALGFVFYMLCAAFGITALVLAVPYAYDTIRIAGALYLLWLAWQAVRPGGRSPFQVEDLPKDSPSKLTLIGFLTNLLNPKIAVSAASIAVFLTQRPTFALVQRWVMGTVLAGLAVRMATETRR